MTTFVTATAAFVYVFMALIIAACFLSAGTSYLRQALRRANQVIREAPWPSTEPRSHVRRVDRLTPYDWAGDE